jgi:hypothetical protein
MDGQKVARRVLKDGDIVSLGVHELVYRDLRGAEELVAESADEEADDGPDETPSAEDSGKNLAANDNTA